MIKTDRIACYLLSLFLFGCSQQPSKVTTIAKEPALAKVESSEIVNHVASKTDTTDNTAKANKGDELSETQATLPTATNQSPSAESKPVERAPVNVAPEASPSKEAEPATKETTSDAATRTDENVVVEINPAVPTPLDLTSFYAVPAVNLDNLGRGTWVKAPRDSVTLGGVPLKIGGAFYTWGAGNAGRGMIFPLYYEAIPVDRKFDSLYIYHCTFHSSQDGTPVANLIFNYEDNDSSSVEILYGNHVRDWWKKPDESDEIHDPRSTKIFRHLFPDAEPGQPDHIQMFLSEIANPQPAKKVVSLDIVSAKEESALCVMAMTTGPKGVLKVEPKKSEPKSP